jgi:hypothetical protein
VLEPPLTIEPYGTFAGAEVMLAKGTFRSDPAGAYRVPYEITFRPRGNGRGDILVEPPHAVTRLGARDYFLGPAFLFAQKVDHAAVGYEVGPDNRILDPSRTDVFINTGSASSIDIVGDFAAALREDNVARQLLGRIQHVVITGYSQSADVVCELLTSGRKRPNDRPLFDLVALFTYIGESGPLQSMQAGRLPDTKVVLLQSEFEVLNDVAVHHRDVTGTHRHQYRWWEVAGAPHIPEPLTAVVPFLSFPNTPIGFQPELRALFSQGLQWIRTGREPGPNVLLQTGEEPVDPVYGEFTGIARDNAGNALALFAEFDRNGLPVTRPAPRHPAIELAEATFRARRVPYPLECLGGDVLAATVKSIGQPGFHATYQDYLLSFGKALEQQLRQGLVLAEDAGALLRLASLSPPFTYTESYLAGLWQ